MLIPHSYHGRPLKSYTIEKSYKQSKSGFNVDIQSIVNKGGPLGMQNTVGRLPDFHPGLLSGDGGKL